VAAFESVDPEGAELGWKIRFGHFSQPQRGGIIHAELLETLITLL
jgi:hypothetical protein